MRLKTVSRLDREFR